MTRVVRLFPFAMLRNWCPDGLSYFSKMGRVEWGWQVGKKGGREWEGNKEEAKGEERKERPREREPRRKTCSCHVEACPVDREVSAWVSAGHLPVRCSEMDPRSTSVLSLMCDFWETVLFTMSPLPICESIGVKGVE